MSVCFPLDGLPNHQGCNKASCWTEPNHAGYLPEFVTVTDGKKHDVTAGRALEFPKGSIVAIDKGYNDYTWYKQLTEKRIYFVIRLKTNAKYRAVSRRPVLKSKGLSCDQIIEFTGVQTAKRCSVQLRCIVYRDAETGKRYVFLTNNFKLSVRTIADIYKARWQVELFFKWIKQNLKIKSFVGTSKNAVMTQAWIALCVYLLLAFLKFQSKLQKSTQQILRVLQLNLFEKRDLMALFRGDPPRDNQPDTNSDGFAVKVNGTAILWNIGLQNIAYRWKFFYADINVLFPVVRFPYNRSR